MASWTGPLVGWKLVHRRYATTLGYEHFVEAAQRIGSLNPYGMAGPTKTDT